MINWETDFKTEALETFRLQAEKCVPYKEYLDLIECNTQDINEITQIPFLPIELFKSHEVYCGDTPPEAIFTSSGEVSSRHFMQSLKAYEEAYTQAFKQFYGEPKEWGIYALLPSYLEREGSSLIYMVEGLIKESGGGGFYLYDHQKLLADMAQDPRQKILLGVTYALLDLAENQLVTTPLKDTIVMETGGMKGHRKELPKSELHKILTKAFGVEKIHSEFGMAELTSQGYSKGDGIFQTPPWMKILVRDLADPFALSTSGRGGLNIIDLASKSSCAFIQSQDIGTLYDDGSFTIDGRITGSDTRGCNLLIQ